MSLTAKAFTDGSYSAAFTTERSLQRHETPNSTEEIGHDPAVDAAVVIIDPRLLIRECMAKCFGALIGPEVRTYASLADWAADTSVTHKTLLILACLDERRTIAKQIEQLDQDLARVSPGVPLPPLVFLSDEEDINEIVAALDSGARGYIPTSVSLEIAVEALNLVRAGGVFFPASVFLSAKRMLKTISTEERSPLSGIFTERQAAVVKAIRQGKANKMIAYELNMHESTVKVHVRNIMKKLKAQNRTQVAYLTQHLFRGTGN
jgi:DNA-binding NarL/FixJ family response regulator